MGVASQVGHRSIPVGGPLDAAGTEDAVGVAVVSDADIMWGGCC